MMRMQIRFPDPLDQRLMAIADEQGWSLAEVMRKAAEHFVSWFPEQTAPGAAWKFPTLECGGDFLTDPATLHPEASR